MLNWVLVYALGISFGTSLVLHRRLIVPSRSGWCRRAGGTLLRMWSWALVLLLGFGSGIPGKGYVAWWEAYVSEHSMLLWFLTTVPFTGILYLVKVSTFYVYRSPDRYGCLDEAMPCLHRLDMKVPLIWNTVYWAWLLGSPTLPFFSCFVRLFLMGSSEADLFSLLAVIG